MRCGRLSEADLLFVKNALTGFRLRATIIAA